MNERILHMSVTLVDPEDDAGGLGVLEGYFQALFPMTIVGVSASPVLDDADGTIDIDDDGVNVISGILCADANVPGSWKSTHIGGTNAPVQIAEDSLVSFDCNGITGATSMVVHVWYLAGERLL